VRDFILIISDDMRSRNVTWVALAGEDELGIGVAKAKILLFVFVAHLFHLTFQRLDLILQLCNEPLVLM